MKKELYVNAMVTAKGLPQLFITLSMAETHWPHLREILQVTDNGDTNPTNRSYHVTMFYIQHICSIKKYGIMQEYQDGVL